MADGIRQLLLKFKGDFSDLKDHFKGIQGMVKDTSALFKSERDKDKADAKAAADEAKSLLIQQTQLQMNLIKARQKAAEATTNYEKANAAAQIKRIQTQSQEIANQQRLLALASQLASLNKQQSGGGISQLFSKFASSATSGGGLLGSLVAGAAGGGAFAVFEKLSESLGELMKTFAEMPTRAGELAEGLEKAAARAGLTIPQFQQLRLVAAASGVDINTLGRSVARMNLSLSRGGQGISKAEKEFKAFGVSFRDGQQQLLPANEILKKVAGLFETLPPGMTKSRLAADLFSQRIGNQMIPLLNQGSEAVQNLYDKSEKYSILVNEDLIEAQHKYNIETESLKMQWEQFTVSMGSGLLPMLTNVLSVMNDIAAVMLQTSGANTTKQFSLDIEDWARSKGQMTKGKLKTSAKGRAHMDETAPEALQKSVYTQVYGDQAGGSFDEGTSYGELYTKLRSAGKETSTLSQIFATTFPDALEKSGEAAKGLDSRLQDNSKSMQKLNDATIKYNEVVAQFKEKQEEANITAKAFDLKKQYDEGLVSQTEFIKQSKDLDKEQYDSKVKYLNQYQTLEIQKVQSAAEQQKNQMGGEEPGEGVDQKAYAAEQQGKITLVNEQTAEKIKTIKVQTQEKIFAADQDYAKKKQALDIEGITAYQKSLEIYSKTNLKVQEDSLAEQKSILESQLKQQVISVDTYMEERKRQIQDELKLAIDAAQQEYNAGKKTAEATANLDAKTREARSKGEKDLTQLILGENQLRQTASTGRYTGFTGINQAKLTAAQAVPGAGGTDAANEARQGIILANQQFQADQQKLLQSTTPLTEEWFKILENIQKASAEIQKMNLELAQSKNVVSGGGSLLGMLGGLLGNFGVTRGGVGKVGSAGNLLGQLGSFQSARAANPSTKSTSAGGVFADAADAFKTINWHDLGDAFGKLSKGLMGAVGAVGSFVSIIGSSQGHAGDIAGGGLAGAGMGQGIGSMFSSLSKNAGPIGAIAGAAFGAVLSGIVGQKNNATQDYINSVNKQMQALQDSISNGTTGLQAGIQQLTQLRAGVLGEEGNSKKKQKTALQQEAQSITNQITQLQQQVTDMFVDLTNQLKVLNAPEQFQPLLSSLQDIYTQYKKLQGAASNATQLAQANQFLTASLANFASTESTQLSQAEQSAIEDALKLNDLLQQRKDLMTSEAQSEYDIMTQGVLVNQRTAAQTKMAQIQADRNQYNIQLDQLNQQINLTTYKVNSEQQIFNLAATRIGLEAQLLALQEAQSDKDLLKIQALQQVVQMLQNGSGGSTLDSVLAALGLEQTSSATTNSPSPGVSSLIDQLTAFRNRQGASGWSPMTQYLNS